MKPRKISLKNLLLDKLKTGRVLSRDDVFKIAEDHEYLQSTAERRMRFEDGWERDDIQRLNVLKKPCKKNEFIAYFSWKGAKNIWKKYEKRRIR